MLCFRWPKWTRIWDYRLASAPNIDNTKYSFSKEFETEVVAKASYKGDC